VFKSALVVPSYGKYKFFSKQYVCKICWGDFCIGTILKWGDIDKCGGDIDGSEFAVGRFDQVPFEDVFDEDIKLLLEKRDSQYR
jgi:hypothetical protein